MSDHATGPKGTPPRMPAPEPPDDAFVIEFPDDPNLPVLPAAGEVHATVETEEPPDTHSIRERWARLADVGGGW